MSWIKFYYNARKTNCLKSIGQVVVCISILGNDQGDGGSNENDSDDDIVQILGGSGSDSDDDDDDEDDDDEDMEGIFFQLSGGGQ